MKRWEDVLLEQPSKELSAQTEARVFAEMASANRGRRWWLQMAGFTMGAAAMFGSYSFLRPRTEGPGSEEQILLELAADDSLNLENIEDLEIIEILEELEQWPNG